MIIQPLLQRNMLWLVYFEGLKEDLNYSLYDLKIMGYPSIKEFAYNERNLANWLYAGKWGNSDKDDGYKYMGRGIFKVRGKDNYAKLQKMFGYPFLEHPELLERFHIASRVVIDLFGDMFVDQHILESDWYKDMIEEMNIGKEDICKISLL